MNDLQPSLIFCCEKHLGLGDNINGPSVIRVPSWIKGAPGKYLMYFAHHNGDYIRLAHSNSPLENWQLYEGGCLHLKNISCIADHIASPDSIVVDEEEKIRLYFHGYRKKSIINRCNRSDGQVTFCAISKDGISFSVEEVELGPYYMRVFREKNIWFAIAKYNYDGSILLRSEDGLSPFVKGPQLLPRSRHVGLQRDGEQRLWIYFSRIGDNPERILKSELIKKGDWQSWYCTEILEVKKPEYNWEGADCPKHPSNKGVINERACQLRDPYVFTDIDGKKLFVLLHCWRERSGCSSTLNSNEFKKIHLGSVPLQNSNYLVLIFAVFREKMVPALLILESGFLFLVFSVPRLFLPCRQPIEANQHLLTR